MNPDRLRSLLREAPVPVSGDAERRGREVLEEAFDQRQPRPRAPLPRLVAALAAAALLGAVLLSPAGASVRGWVGDVFTVGVPDAEPGLAGLPAGGRLLVQSQAGPWVVNADGSRRLLGDFREATWSPRGLFVAVSSGRELSAVKPDGTPRWTLAASSPVADARWAPDGFQIAYRSGGALRVTDADGSGDRLIARNVAPIAPVWSPLGTAQLAFVDAGGRLRIVDAENGTMVGSVPALPDLDRLEWGASGTLVEVGPGSLRVRRTAVQKLAQAIAVGPPRDLPLPSGALVRDTALAPSGRTIAALLVLRGAGGPRSVVLLIPADGGGARRLLSVPGRLGELAWAPNERRLLISWPEADQWLFLSPGPGRGRAVGDIAAAFAPGQAPATFPRIEGWCCSTR